MNSVFFEAVKNPYWMMEVSAFTHYRHMMEQDILGRVVLDANAFQHRVHGFISLHADGGITSTNFVSEDFDGLQAASTLTEGDQLVHINYVEGPITRNGGGCSYGSIQIRDMMIRASQIQQCVAQVVYINSPGGSVGCELDFQQGVDAAHAAGQKVIAIVDGMAASMGYNFACRCDEIWCVNPKHEVGCIGCLIAYYSLEDGVANAITGEKYVEMYATQSTEKNREFRDLALGNRELMQQTLDKHAQEFMDAVKAHRPNVTDDMLTGKMYPADEVMGTMVDRIGTMDQLLSELFSTPVQSEPSEPSDPQPENNVNQNYKPMDLQRLSQAAGVETLEVQDGGVFLTSELAESVVNTLAEMDTQLATLTENAAQQTNSHEAAVAELNNQISELTARNENLNTTVDTMQQQLNDLFAQNNQLTAAQQTATEQSENHTHEVEELNSRLSERDQRIAELEQQLAERDAEIAEMSGRPSAQQVPAAPQGNSTTTAKESNTIFKPGMTRAEMREAWKKRFNY